MIDRNLPPKYFNVALKWGDLSIEELEKLKVEFEDKAGNTLIRIVSKYTYYFINILVWLIVMALFGFILLTLSFKVAGYFPNSPRIRYIAVAITFMFCFGFPIWAVSEEKLEQLWSPMTKWGDKVKEQQDAYQKVKGVRYYLKKKRESLNTQSSQ